MLDYLMYLIANIDHVVSPDTISLDGAKKKNELRRRINGLLLRFYDHILSKNQEGGLNERDQAVFNQYQ